jgi:hypothetical protein
MSFQKQSRPLDFVKTHTTVNGIPQAGIDPAAIWSGRLANKITPGNYPVTQYLGRENALTVKMHAEKQSLVCAFTQGLNAAVTDRFLNLGLFCFDGWQFAPKTQFPLANLFGTITFKYTLPVAGAADQE